MPRHCITGNECTASSEAPFRPRLPQTRLRRITYTVDTADCSHSARISFTRLHWFYCFTGINSGSGRDITSFTVIGHAEDGSNILHTDVATLKLFTAPAAADRHRADRQAGACRRRAYASSHRRVRAISCRVLRLPSRTSTISAPLLLHS